MVCVVCVLEALCDGAVLPVSMWCMMMVDE